MSRSLFVTIEGGEGAGKSTLLTGLERALRVRHLSVVATREPGGTPLGELLRTQLLQGERPLSPQAELLLILAARAQHIAEVIKPALARGALLLCDRFSDSTIAYQGWGRALDVESIEPLCLYAAEGLQPDLTLLLDIDPMLGLARAGGGDRFESEEIAFHTRVRQGLLAQAKKHSERIITLDATTPPQQLLTEALEWIERRLR